MFYKPKLNDLIIVHHSDTLGQVIKLFPKFKQVEIKIIKSHIREREGDNHLVNNSSCRLVWRRMSEDKYNKEADL